MAGLTFVVILASGGFRSAPGVLFDPLKRDLGWSKSVVGAGVSVNLILYGLAGPFAAASMQRFGIRAHITGALLLQVVGAAATLVMTQPWHFVLSWGVLMGIGSGAISSVLAATVANRWFIKRRGLVTGALMAAGASGQLVFLPVLSRLAEHVSWQAVSIVVGTAAAAAIPLVLLGFRNAPADLGLAPYGGTQVVAVAMRPRPVAAAFEGLRLARRSKAFWLLWGSFAVCGLSTNGLIGTHFVPAGADHGMSEPKAAGFLAFIGIFDIAGTVLSGVLTDRVDPRKLLFAYYAFRGLSLLVLHQALGAASLGLWGFIIFYGLDWVATVPPTVALCSQLFGIERGAIVYGWVFAGHQVGAAVAAFGAGLIRDVTGSYQLAFIISGATCLVAALGVLKIPSAVNVVGRSDSVIGAL
jgi:predicted MFS family arabinose efflux permease